MSISVHFSQFNQTWLELIFINSNTVPKDSPVIGAPTSMQEYSPYIYIFQDKNL
jgi:hypothetical protein